MKIRTVLDLTHLGLIKRLLLCYSVLRHKAAFVDVALPDIQVYPKPDVRDVN